MDLPPITDDVLAHSIRARLFQALAQLRRPATTRELAAQVGRHPNSVRVQLRRLADDPGLRARLAAHPGPVRDEQDAARQLLGLYDQLVRGRQPGPGERA